jgi:hypothetical protein
MSTVDGVVELPYIVVDEPPGTDGYQAQHPDADVPSVPHYEDGENPPGTDPPTPPAVDPATILPPGTDPFPVPEGAGDPQVAVDTAPRGNPALTEIPGTHPFPFVPQVTTAEQEAQAAEAEFGLEDEAPPPDYPPPGQEPAPQYASD